jgi:hypothetical protein
LEVVDVTATGLDLSPPDGITRGLAVRHKGGTTGSASRCRLEDSLPAWDIGVSRFWRVYVYVAMPDTPNNWGEAGDGGFHPIQDGAGGSNTNWEFNLVFDTTPGSHTVPTGKVRFTIDTGGAQIGYYLAGGKDTPEDFDKGAWYRCEWGFERLSSTAFDFLGMRVYNSAGTLLFDEDDFLQASDDEPASVVTSRVMNNPANVVDQQCGSNGWGGGLNEGATYTGWIWAAFAITEGDWPGPYSGGI